MIIFVVSSDNGFFNFFGKFSFDAGQSFGNVQLGALNERGIFKKKRDGAAVFFGGGKNFLETGKSGHRLFNGNCDQLFNVFGRHAAPHPHIDGDLRRFRVRHHVDGQVEEADQSTQTNADNHHQSPNGSTDGELS
ncbi:MAG: hypothetical protein KCHDKBKB_00885 [Elusimicrobia bacterium]|nr:hypothetical protein [Elusimicrobiota bacterium]